MPTPRLLIAYDGSTNAKNAIEMAASHFPGATSILFFARQPMEGVAAHLQGHAAFEDLAGLNKADLDASEQLAVEGAQLANQLGLEATPIVSSTFATASEAIIEAAEEHDVDLIVLGSRGLRGLRATILGSTSANVLHHSTRPTLVIPSEALARARYQSRSAKWD